MKNDWEPVDIAVIGLLVILFLVLAGAIISPLFLGDDFFEKRAKYIANVSDAILAIIAVYVGARLQKLRNGDR